MAECISKFYKDKIDAWIDITLSMTVLDGLVSKWPTCPGNPCIAASYKEEIAAVAATPNIQASALKPLVNLWEICGTTRKKAAEWPSAVYIDASGKAESWDSPSALYKHLTGKKVSGTVDSCDIKGCTAGTLVDNFTMAGFLVKGDGEDPPARPKSETGKLSGATKNSYVQSHQIWKQQLKDRNMKFVVIDPKAKVDISTLASAVNPEPAPAKLQAKLEAETADVETAEDTWNAYAGMEYPISRKKK